MTQRTIGNPLSWITGQLFHAGEHASAIAEHVSGHEAEAPPEIRSIGLSDIRAALTAGYDDFVAVRSDVLFLCVLYPIIGGVLFWAVINQDLVQLLGPVVAGFALVGPVAGVGMYELSRRRAAGLDARWYHAIGVLRAPGFGAMLLLSFILLGVFVVWLGAAALIYSLTLEPMGPHGVMSLLRDTLTTSAGWTMAIVGTVVGFFFALAVLVASVISFPMLLDRNVGIVRAVETSIRVTQKNPFTILLWGGVVAALLVVGSIPALIGLVFVLPILGHATWHLYRRAVV